MFAFRPPVVTNKARPLVPLIGLLLVSCTPWCAMEGTANPPGSADEFDPVEALPEVRKFGGSGLQLVSIEARGVRPDGTIDIEQGMGSVVYRFRRTRPGAEQFEQGFVEVDVKEPKVNNVGGMYFRGMGRQATGPEDEPEQTAGKPTCTFTALWKAASGSGAKGDKATIVYDHEGYEFRDDRGFQGGFAPDCTPVP
jgi:hypothetical protein